MYQARRISRFDGVGTTSGDVGTLLYRVSEDPKQDDRDLRDVLRCIIVL